MAIVTFAPRARLRLSPLLFVALLLGALILLSTGGGTDAGAGTVSPATSSAAGTNTGSGVSGGGGGGVSLSGTTVIPPNAVRGM